ncbi:hypothetical protein M0657_005471 [Pyricularia oryzae]|uniref:Uncharacterized protein n=2 Tax=Pyricularia oryzae TaxID=318829 RepID=A0AA97PS56_PYRO3|nr:hypothetical protein OOU_Y34scaffold00033g7 [Pyricularia oryzae Y34]KAI7919752.1 hypothetical protein M9X92_006232 [Pyricularia oryzae]KAI7922711.1 hypothetical protein M0657_005471 [Pyricularia oryzae]
MASNPQFARLNGAPTAASVPAGDDTWDEAKYEASLKHLHELHLQATAELFPALQQSMASGVKDVKDFKDSMSSRETNKIISRAYQSRQKNPLQIKPWRPKDDSNWAQMDLD